MRPRNSNTLGSSGLLSRYALPTGSTRWVEPLSVCPIISRNGAPFTPGGKIAEACTRMTNSPVLGKLFSPMPPDAECRRLPHTPISSKPIPRFNPCRSHSRRAVCTSGFSGSTIALVITLRAFSR